MRLVKKPPMHKKVQDRKAIINAFYSSNTEPKSYKNKDFQVQTVDGFVQKLKLCVGISNKFQKSKPIFTSKVKGVFYEVYANVCKMPYSEMVVGVIIEDPVLGNRLEIDGYNFTKEDGVLQFIDNVHSRHVGANVIKEI